MGLNLGSKPAFQICISKSGFLTNLKPGSNLDSNRFKPGFRLGFNLRSNLGDTRQGASALSFVDQGKHLVFTVVQTDESSVFKDRSLLTVEAPGTKLVFV